MTIFAAISPRHPASCSTFEKLHRLIDRQRRQFRQTRLADEHVARAAVQALAVTIRARPFGDELGEFLAHGRRFGFAIAPFQIRDDAFEPMFARDAAAGFGEIAERNDLVARARQNRVTDRFRQLFPRRVDVELVVTRQRQDQLEVIHVAPIPAAHRAGGEAQVRMHDDARRIEHLRDAEAVAGSACADRRIEREQARFEFRQRVVADRTREARRECRRRRFVVVHVDEQRDAVAETQCGLERFGQTLFDVGRGTEAIDHRFDGVFLTQRQRRHRIEFVQNAVDARTHETLCAQLIEHLQMFALALANDRREQHETLFRIQRERRIDHLAHGLRLQRNVMIRTARRSHAREQQTQVIVDFGDGADGRARIVRGRFLFDRNRRTQAFDVIHIGLFHHRQKLARIRRQRFDVAPLAFRVDRVERERRFAGTRQSRDHDQAVARQLKIDIFQIVRASAADANEIHRFLFDYRFREAGLSQGHKKRQVDTIARRQFTGTLQFARIV